MIFKPSLMLGAFAAGAALILGVYWYGYFAAAGDYKAMIAEGKAKFARHIGAANKNTFATKERLAGVVKDREATIDQWKSKYDELLAKNAAGVCAIDDDDVRFDVRSRVRPPNYRNPRPKS